MQYSEINTPNWGRVLWIKSDLVEVGVALEFGIRIVYLSCVGYENLFYEQPADLSDGFTEGDWCLYGGHRLWLAPESTESYYPDNSPVRYSVLDQGFLFEQDVDTLLQVRKRLFLTFLRDDCISVRQEIENISNHTIRGAAWGINTLDGGGIVDVSFAPVQGSEYTPNRYIALWGDTNVADPRLRFEHDSLCAMHFPSSNNLKIGLYSKPGIAVYRNKKQRFELTFNADPVELYPDGGCNFELFMSKQFVELESLGHLTDILPGQCAVHTETWRLDYCY